jgi:hypothetical protein
MRSHGVFDRWDDRRGVVVLGEEALYTFVAVMRVERGT